MTLVNLAAGPLALTIDAVRGGGITGFWRGDFPLFVGRPNDSSPLGLACFALLPFSNRIAHGRFGDVQLPRNHPAHPDHPHAIHGLGWQAPWQVVTANVRHCALRLDMSAGAWPWRWRGEQWLDLSDDGLCHRIAITNGDSRAMPAGLGLHPWFTCDAETRLVARHRGEWQTAPDGLPLALNRAPQPRDWWGGAPVASRPVDTVYTGREGPLRIEWPGAGLALTISPSELLDFTVVYVPEGAPHFCVEPVSHMTDALNRPEPSAFTGLRWLAPGETLAARVDYRVSVPGR